MSRAMRLLRCHPDFSLLRGQNAIHTWLLSDFAASLLALLPGTAVLSVCYVILEHLNVAVMQTNDLFLCSFSWPFFLIPCRNLSAVYAFLGSTSLNIFACGN